MDEGGGTESGGAAQPGWWVASDGRWYPPEQHPDAGSAPVARAVEPGPVAPVVDPPRAAGSRRGPVLAAVAAVIVVVVAGAALALVVQGGDDAGESTLAVEAPEPPGAPVGTRPPGSSPPGPVGASPGTTVLAAVPGAPGVLAERSGAVGSFEAPVAWFDQAGAAEPVSVIGADEDVIASVGSPDGRYVARSVGADAATAGWWEVIETDTGDQLLEVPYDAPTSTSLRWALDSSAFVFVDGRSLHLQRLEGGEATAEYREGLPFDLDKLSFASDDRSTSIVTCSSSWVITLDLGGEVTYADHEDSMGFCAQGEAVGSDGLSVALYSSDGSLRRLLPDGSSTPVALTGATDADAYPKVIESCRGSILVNDRDGYGVLVPGSGSVAIVDGRVRGSCPLLAPDRQAAAWWGHQQPGPVLVADVATGASVEVARIGAPVGWSTDSEDLLVLADQVFVVAADGSGGDELDPGLSSSRLTRWCRLGSTGKVLVGDGRSLAVIDIGERSATALPAERSLEGSCATTSDGEWVLVGRLLIDLEEARVHELALHRLDEPRAALSHYRWRDPHEATVIGDAGLYRSSD